MRALPLLLLAPLLAGCLATPQPAAPGADALAGLTAEGAAVAREGDALTFAWDGEVQPSAGVGFVAQAGTPPDTRVFSFQVGPGLGRITATVTSEPVTIVTLRDEHGAPVCSKGATGGGVCDLPGPPGLSRPVTWTATIVAQEDPDTPWPYVATVTLPTPFHFEVQLQAGQPARPGDPAAGTDPAIAFGLSRLGPGGEPSLGATGSGALFVVQGTTVQRSRDGGASWDDVTPPWDRALGFTLDPFLYGDQRTGRVLVSHLNLACSMLHWSDDEGQTWVPSPAGCLDPVQDHQKLAVGDHPGPFAVYDGTMYYSESKVWASLAEANRTAIVVSRSLDNGLSWEPSVAHLGENEHRGQGNLLADSAGNVFVTFPDRFPIGAADVNVAVSHDHGLTWRGVVAIPGLGPGGAPIDPDVALDAAGHVYVVTEGADGRVWMAASSDHGDTFGAPFTVSPPGLTNGPFTAAIGGDAGQLAVAYLASPDTDRNANDAPTWARYHLYVTFVEDALGASPRTTTGLATPADDPVQRGAICTRGIACAGGGEQRNLADFIDATVLPDGRVAVAYTDGCLEDCATSADSRASEVMVAVLRTGPLVGGAMDSP